MDAELEIRRRIQEREKITFAEFMEIALFWPRGGYYSSLGTVGTEGDFYTAPSAHSAFAALLSVQLFQMWRLLDSPSTFWLVEMGAGDGLLCYDLIEYSVHLPRGFQESLRYLCLDRLPLSGVEEHLPTDGAKLVDRLASQALPLHGIRGCFLSNELLDSFPVHRVTIENGALKEVYLAMEDGKLAEVLDSPSTPALHERLENLGLSLPEGFSTEINLAMEPWVKEVSSALERGFLLTVDYGHIARELYSHSRSRGTLTCYYRHSQTSSPYQRIGRQDISAQVDFTSLAEMGTRSGLELLGFNTQREFLHNLGIQRFIEWLPRMGLKQREVEANRLGMLDIVRSGGMGEFKVLVQGKGVGRPSLWGSERSLELDAILEKLPVPLLGSRHTPLLEGRYPHLTHEWEGLWPTGGVDHAGRAGT